MKICVLTHGVMPFGRQYAQLFARRGHEVELFSMTPCEPVPGVPTRVFARFDAGGEGSRLQYLRCVLPIRTAVRRMAPDVLFAIYMTSAGVVGALTGCRPLVVSALGSDVNASTGSRTWRSVLGMVCRRSALVHAVSNDLAAQLRERMGVPSSKILVSPVGVDTGRLVPAAEPVRSGTGRIICTRSHATVYDHPTLLRATAILKGRGVPFHVTFTHRKSGVARHLAHELGVEDRVTFRDGYADEELPGLLGEHDVYVSCSRSDGTSQSLLEAMSCGLFPVVSAIPANTPWIDDGTGGYLFPVGDATALADRLQDALANSDLRAAAAVINRRKVLEHGDREKEADRLLEAFRGLTKQGETHTDSTSLAGQWLDGGGSDR